MEILETERYLKVLFFLFVKSKDKFMIKKQSNKKLKRKNLLRITIQFRPISTSGLIRDFFRVYFSLRAPFPRNSE